MREEKLIALGTRFASSSVEVLPVTFCAWCGAAIPLGDRFCSSCGRPVAGLVPPPPSNSTAVLLTVVIVVVVGLVLAFAAALYTMTTGLIDGNGTSKPVVALTVSKTANGADILIAGIQPTEPPSDFRVNIENVSSTAFGTAVLMPTSPGGSVTVTVPSGAVPTVFSIQWQNPGGSGLVSQGDHFVISLGGGPYPLGTTYAFLLIWSDGSTLTSIDWQV